MSEEMTVIESIAKDVAQMNDGTSLYLIKITMMNSQVNTETYVKEELRNARYTILAKQLNQTIGV